jgi:uncharacterized protein (TIGR03067 family)
MTPLLLAVPFVFAAPVPKELRAVKSDAEVMLGTWEVVASNHHNKANAGSTGIKYIFRADGTCLIIHQNGSEHGPVKVGLDPKASPKTYSWVTPWGTWKGAYELTGDTMKMAARGEKAGPPGAVAPGENVEYSELRRVK